MKKMKIKTIKKEEQKNDITEIQEMNFASEFFKCEECGYTVRYRVLGDTARCGRCGGTMYRC